MPWKNGLGTTIELLRKNTSDSDEFLWRLSKAAVSSDGAFSNFSGYDRTLVLLCGNGITLEHGNNKRNVLYKPLQFAKFDGGANTRATLHNGEITDFNIMTKSNSCQTTVHTSDAEQRLSNAADELFVYSVDKTLSVRFATHQPIELPADHLLTLTGSDEGIVCGGGPSIIIAIKYTI